MSDNNLYSVLGLLPSAEDKVIKSAYKVLSSIYHPDKNNSPASLIKMQDINRAYEVLGNPLKRKKYDEDNGFNYNEAKSTDFDSNSSFNDNDLNSTWEVIVSIYPEVQRKYLDLNKLSGSLALSFKLTIVDEKKYDKFKEIADTLKTEFLNKYFGGNKKVMRLGEKIITLNERDAALYLNKIVNIMGSAVEFKAIEKEVLNKFPDLDFKIKIFDLYNGLDDPYIALDCASELVKMEGGTVKKSLLSSKITINIFEESIVFNKQSDFLDFSRKRYKDVFV